MHGWRTSLVRWSLLIYVDAGDGPVVPAIVLSGDAALPPSPILLELEHPTHAASGPRENRGWLATRARIWPSTDRSPLVLGGSEGIGREFAAELAGAGLDLVLVARGGAALEAAAVEIRAQHKVAVTTLTQDLAVADLAPFIEQIVGAHDVGLVVCNAGATHGVGHVPGCPA